VTKKTLREVMPKEFMGPEYDDAPARKWADVEVIAEYDATNRTQRWPGKHKSVFYWCALKNGRAVGFNENPGKGWSFPCIRWSPKETSLQPEAK
jgi:hypothetical protein